MGPVCSQAVHAATRLADSHQAFSRSQPLSSVLGWADTGVLERLPGAGMELRHGPGCGV